jgi:hypothetical protein
MLKKRNRAAVVTATVERIEGLRSNPPPIVQHPNELFVPASVQFEKQIPAS